MILSNLWSVLIWWDAIYFCICICWCSSAPPCDVQLKNACKFFLLNKNPESNQSLISISIYNSQHNFFLEKQKVRSTGGPLPQIYPVGVHTRWNLYKKLGGVLTRYTKLMLEFGPAQPYKPSWLSSDFLKSKVFENTSSLHFFLRIILAEGSYFLFHLIGKYELQSKLWHVIKKPSAMYTWLFCKLQLYFCYCQILE